MLPVSRQVAWIRRTRWYLGPVFHESRIRQATVRDLYVCRIQIANVWGMNGGNPGLNSM